MVVTLGRQYNTGGMRSDFSLKNTGEIPIVILYTYINRHAGTPDKK